MSYSSTLDVVQNDYGYDLEFQLKDASNNAVDLTGATEVKIFVAEAGAQTAKVVGDCVVTDASNGLVKYTVQDGDFDEGNKEYQVEIELHFVGSVLTARGVTIYVVSELPESTS